MIITLKSGKIYDTDVPFYLHNLNKKEVIEVAEIKTLIEISKGV